MTVFELYNYLGEWIDYFPEDADIPVVCTDSIRFDENGLHDITEGIVIVDKGVNKLQLWQIIIKNYYDNN